MLWRFLNRCCLFVLTGLLVVQVAPVMATGVMVEPAFQFITIAGDQTQVEATVRLTNQTDTTQTFRLSTIDIRQFDESGRVGLVDKPVADAQYTLASYLRLPEEQIEVGPAQTREVQVIVENSVGFSPGGHYGAVLAEVVSQGSEGEQVVVPAVSAILLVHKVGGERFHLNLKRVLLPEIWFSLPSSIQLQFENQGNVHVVPHGQVVLTDVFNRRVAEGIINEGSLVIMPETQRVIGVNLAGRAWALPFVPLTLKIEGKAEPGNLQYGQSAVVGYLPLLSLMVGLLVVAVLVRVFRRYVTRKHHS